MFGVPLSITGILGIPLLGRAWWKLGRHFLLICCLVFGNNSNIFRHGCSIFSASFQRCFVNGATPNGQRQWVRNGRRKYEILRRVTEFPRAERCLLVSTASRLVISTSFARFSLTFPRFAEVSLVFFFSLFLSHS